MAPLVVALVIAIVPGLRGFVGSLFDGNDNSGPSDVAQHLNIKPRLVSNTRDAISIRDGATTRITFRPLNWAGLLVDIPLNVHAYRLEFDARLVTVARPAEGAGWGYGVGVCDRWDGDTPAGFILQYAEIQNKRAIQPNPGRFTMPFVNDGLRVPVVVDDQIHHWVVTMRNRQVEASIDYGAPVGPYPVTRHTKGPKMERQLPTHCDGADIFLRVFGTTAAFSNIKVDALK